MSHFWPQKRKSNFKKLDNKLEAITEQHPAIRKNLTENEIDIMQPLVQHQDTSKFLNSLSLTSQVAHSLKAAQVKCSHENRSKWLDIPSHAFEKRYKRFLVGP
jgi:hypothetical protein